MYPKLPFVKNARLASWFETLAYPRRPSSTGIQIQKPPPTSITKCLCICMQTRIIWAMQRDTHTHSREDKLSSAARSCETQMQYAPPKGEALSKCTTVFWEILYFGSWLQIKGITYELKHTKAPVFSSELQCRIHLMCVNSHNWKKWK